MCGAGFQGYKGSTMSSTPVVLITGASRGIGAATAIYFARHGYDVCINYKTS